jgi:hypothetical protein
MHNPIIDQIIKKEIQLLDKTDSLEVLTNLIDDEFIEIGSSASVYDKEAIIQWLASGEQYERIGTSFKGQQLAKDIILLTYISSIKDTPSSNYKKAMRSSIWRLRNDQWRMVFHQGTPVGVG